MKNVHLKISGMSYANCVKHVTKALSEIPGISDIKVDLAQADVHFSLDDLNKTNLIIKTLTECGYPAIIA